MDLNIFYKAVYTWFKNNKPFKDRAVFRIERKIPLRRVVGKLRAEEIHSIISDKYPDVQKGEKDYPGLFQKCLTEYLREISSEEMEEMEKIRDEWQLAAPPVDIQLK